MSPNIIRINTSLTGFCQVKSHRDIIDAHTPAAMAIPVDSTPVTIDAHQGHLYSV